MACFAATLSNAGRAADAVGGLVTLEDVWRLAVGAGGIGA
jgi:hypothetical protein